MLQAWQQVAPWALNTYIISHLRGRAWCLQNTAAVVDAWPAGGNYGAETSKCLICVCVLPVESRKEVLVTMSYAMGSMRGTMHNLGSF